MFKDSFTTRLTPWHITEESSGLPHFSYPALVGSGLLGVGLDAAGLQSLPDKITAFLGSKHAPFHATQADLYVLHEGMISEHLYQDEVKHTGRDVPPGEFVYGQRRNFMPLGYLSQEFDYGGRSYAGDAVLSVAGQWRREWDLRRAIVRNRFALDRSIVVETEIFVPHGGETVYLKLTRRPARRVDVHGGNRLSGSDPFRWTVRLPLETRHGLKLYDQPDSVKPGERTLHASIDRNSSYKPTERYVVLYGVAADGMDVSLTADGWSATMAAPLEQEQTAWLRIDFSRFVAGGIRMVDDARDEMEADLLRFNRDEWQQALERHEADFRTFWSNTADVDVHVRDDFELRRRFLLHVSEYLFRCGNDFSFGGTCQFLLFHQNGWGASNFHDSHYIVDGIARANMWTEAESNLWWLRRVMRADSGRAFPWMMTYSGEPTVTPERDRAPMSDANRAMIAIRIYELAGRHREQLLREAAFPIVKRVADMAVDHWFYEQDGRLLFRGVETDVMGAEAIINDAATVMMFLTIIRKALAYRAALGIDDPRRQDWQRVLDSARLDIVNGRYAPHLNARPDAKVGCWLCNTYYLAEAQDFMDDAAYAATIDWGQKVVGCNMPWIGFAAASSEMRLGRSDRAEQHFVEAFEHGTHGPGYYEEVSPVGSYGLPPLGTAHGAHLTAACEQIVISDFWRHRVYVGKGMPAKMRANRVVFSNLRARDGLIVSGESAPRRLAVSLHHTGDPVEMEIVLRVPCEAPTSFQVLADPPAEAVRRTGGRPAAYDFHGEYVTLRLPTRLQEPCGGQVEWDATVKVEIEENDE